ncbi:hypothetical protein BGW80DRAFT_1291185 [Lactifluus volemus]|nr:hypothetical protein BGW80DRAFT_1291185 [Lactifluus volemus]
MAVYVIIHLIPAVCMSSMTHESSEVAFVGKAAGACDAAWRRLLRAATRTKQNPFSPMIKRYPLERLDGEHIGDFVIRAGYISAMRDGQAWDEGIRGEGPYHEIPA